MLQVFILTFILVGLAFLAFGIRMIFDKKSSGIAPSCAANKNMENSSCGCGGGHCQSQSS